MKVNFDNLRRKTMDSYSTLVNTLQLGFINGSIIEVNVQEIKQDIDALRQGLAFIACCHDPQTENFSDLGEEALKMPTLVEEDGE